MDIPKKITPCPLIDTNIEIRFDADYVADAIFGIVYKELQSTYPEMEKLPILQLPDEIRLKDPELKGKAHYKLSNETFVLQIGPKVVSLGSTKEYVGWDIFFNEVKKMCMTIKKLEIIKRVHRLGIRYINFFDFNIFDRINLNVSMNGDKVECDKALFRTEIQDNEFINLLQVASNVTVRSNEKTLVGSVIDIDTHIVATMENFFDVMETLLIEGHNAEKKLFFRLLQSDFLETLNPEY